MPRLPTAAGVRAAMALIEPYHVPTPLVRAELLSAASGVDLWIKNETVSLIGCFKLRGALTDVLKARERGSITRLVTSSSGNHGQGVAYAARLLGLPATIFLPHGASRTKLAMIEALGAEIRFAGPDSSETKVIAARFAEEHGYYFVDDGNSTDLTEGAGTVGLEVADALPRIDAVFIPVGDAALINGSACAIRASHPNTKIIGVQAEGARALAESHRLKKTISIAPDTIADGLAVRVPADPALAGMIALVDEFALVSEAGLLSAVQTLAVSAHTLAEPSGAAGLAAFWEQRQNWQGKTVVLIVTGANTSAQTLAAAFAAQPLWTSELGGIG